MNYSNFFIGLAVVVSFVSLVTGMTKTTEVVTRNIGTEYDGTNMNYVTVEQFTQGGDVLSISTTSATYVLTAAQLDRYNVIEIASVDAPVLALTLPATSTLTKVIPNPGDFREWFIDNKHAAATTTTITAGTGIDLIAVTNADDVIDGQEKSRLSCWRKANDDVACIVSELLAAD